MLRVSKLVYRLVRPIKFSILIIGLFLLKFLKLLFNKGKNN